FVSPPWVWARGPPHAGEGLPCAAGSLEAGDLFFLKPRGVFLAEPPPPPRGAPRHGADQKSGPPANLGLGRRLVLQHGRDLGCAGGGQTRNRIIVSGPPIGRRCVEPFGSFADGPARWVAHFP